MNVTIKRCSCCENLVNVDELEAVRANDGTIEMWCEDCRLANGVERCEHCGELHEAALNEVRVRPFLSWDWVTEYWCDSCVDNFSTTCDCCGDRIFNRNIDSDTMYTGEVVHICESCYENEYVSCNHCGYLVPRDEAIWSERDWEWYCPDHIPSENLHDYGHTDGCNFWLADGRRVSDWNLTEEERNRLYLGIELETDNNDSDCRVADDIAYEFDDDMVECKEDCSLHNNGVEIVSQPMEPAYHLNSGMWDRISEIVRSHGGESDRPGTCGLHIHLSRRYFHDNDAVYRIDRMFHRFKRQMVKFSRRRNFEYCHLDDDDLADIKSVKERKEVWQSRKDRAGRYVAVNDTNYETVEIRLWRGTLDMETFKATVEFTTGLAIVCNSMSDEFADALTWGMFKLLVRFALEQNGISHTELDAYLVRQGL